MVYGALERKIAEREGRLAALERERLEVEAELRAYRDALHLVRDAPTDARASRSAPTVVRQAAQDDGGKRAARGLSGKWVHIWSAVGRKHPGDFSFDDVIHVSEELGHPVSRDNVRSQLWSRGEAGDFRRTSPGMYRMTDQGREAFVGDSIVGDPVDSAESDLPPAIQSMPL
jgi:hypothetical protein